MNTLEKYFSTEIIRSVLFVLLAFVALLMVFDVINEVKNVGVAGYTITNALYYVFLNISGHAYDYMPLSALIGTIFVTARFASHFDSTIMRASVFRREKPSKCCSKLGWCLLL